MRDQGSPGVERVSEAPHGLAGLIRASLRYYLTATAHAVLWTPEWLVEGGPEGDRGGSRHLVRPCLFGGSFRNSAGSTPSVSASLPMISSPT